jgi:hypothetical protein
LSRCAIAARAEASASCALRIAMYEKSFVWGESPSSLNERSA